MNKLTAPTVSDVIYFIVTALGLTFISWLLSFIGLTDLMSAETTLIIALFFWLEWKFQHVTVTANINIKDIDDLRRWRESIRNR